jgi:hypothetical protein
MISNVQYLHLKVQKARLSMCMANSNYQGINNPERIPPQWLLEVNTYAGQF